MDASSVTVTLVELFLIRLSVIKKLASVLVHRKDLADSVTNVLLVNGEIHSLNAKSANVHLMEVPVSNVTKLQVNVNALLELLAIIVTSVTAERLEMLLFVKNVVNALTIGTKQYSALMNF
ncbi:hypothetical protein BpHYR1_052605 [Brachionus plicatilis]|uniref:Uncharacterized protein n=1 Tax=Brachionus plicatilis TaxID=10195 RepID=A0A3M7P4Q1_BRAPC|nr:hypothetical protein BpHYR1_052605 [Brachionus plicatilis]